MKNHFFTLLAVLLTALLTLPACSDSESPTPPVPGPDEPVRATFTHALTLKYYGNKYGNDAGNYLLELTTADGSQSLTLDFSASALTDNPSSPQPEAGDYVLAAAGARTGMTFDGGASDWVVTEGMQETRYRFTGGSFSLSRDGADYALKGNFTAGDNRFECTYDGPLTFENCSDDEIDPEAIVCLGAYGTYYGHFYCPEAYDYYLVIFDTKHAQTGDPYNYRIALDFHSLAPVGDRMPQEGTYPIDAELVFDPGTMVPGHLNENWGIDGSYWSVPKEGGGSTMFPITQGSFTFARRDGVYLLFGTLADGQGNEISFTYEGDLNFNDDSDDSPVSRLEADRAMGSLYHARARQEPASDYTVWSVYLYTEESWTSQGETGDHLKLQLVAPTDAQSLPAGTYSVTVTNHPALGGFLPGYIYADRRALGTWLVRNSSEIVAPLIDGTVTVADTDGDNYRIEFDLTDDAAPAHRLTGSYAGAIEAIETTSALGLSLSASQPAPDRNAR